MSPNMVWRQIYETSGMTQIARNMILLITYLCKTNYSIRSDNPTLISGLRSLSKASTLDIIIVCCFGDFDVGLQTGGPFLC